MRLPENIALLGCCVFVCSKPFCLVPRCLLAFLPASDLAITTMYNFVMHA